MKRLLIFSLILCVVVELKAACPSGTCNAASASLADVNAAINLANHGDIVHIPAGTVTWSTWPGNIDSSLGPFGITKNITLEGSGVTNTIVNSYNPIALSSSNVAGVQRITGISFVSPTNNLGNGIKTFTPGNVAYIVQRRIDHCKFTNYLCGMYITDTFGVTDHNVYTGCRFVWRHSGQNAINAHNRYYPVAWDSLNNMFHEDETVTLIGDNTEQGDDWIAADGAYAQSWVVRKSTFTITGNVRAQKALFDTHGDYYWCGTPPPTDPNSAPGAMTTLLYDNTFNVSGTPDWGFLFDDRGGQAKVFNNTVNGPNANAIVYLREDTYEPAFHCPPWCPPGCWFVHDTYVWNNVYDADGPGGTAGVVQTPVLGPNGGMIVAGTNYFTVAPVPNTLPQYPHPLVTETPPPPPDPTITVNYSVLDYGYVNNGATGSLSFTVGNSGGGTLTGTASVSSPFAIVTSPATYSLTTGQTKIILVSYGPTAGSLVSSANLTFTGGGGLTLPIIGRSPIETLDWDSTVGIIASPFSPSGSTISQTVETTTPSAGGRAQYRIKVAVAGDYQLNALVGWPTASNNSFFYNFDAEPTSPANVWTGTLTTGMQSRPLTWASETTAHVHTLSAGNHDLIVRGREADSLLGHFTMTSVTAPPNQPPLAGISPDVSSGVGPLAVIFTLTSSDSDGTVASGVLNYGDGSSTVPITAPGASTTRSHTYSAVGSLTTYGATWQVTDNDAATSAVATANVTVAPTPPPPPNQPPLAGLSGSPVSGNSPLNVSFVLTSSDPDAGDSVASGVLNYGDGTSPETITTPASSVLRSHSYTNAGPGNVTRTATWQTTDTHSATSAIASKLITISPPVPAAIQVSPSTLPFGSVDFGSFSTLNVTVKNIGGSPLTGTASTSSPFSVTGGGTYTSLAPGAQQVVFVRYTPAGYSANNNGTLTFTGGGGAIVSLSGTSPAEPAPLIPVIQVLPGDLLFKTVAVGAFEDKSVVVKNVGTGTLVGTAAIALPPFFVLNDADYSLPANQSKIIFVRFRPANRYAEGGGGVHRTMTLTGGGGETVSLDGTVAEPPGFQPPSGVIVSPIGTQFITTGSSVSFGGDGIDPAGTDLSYLWNFGSGSGISDSTAQSPGSKTFNNAGTFIVTLTVTNEDEVSDPHPPTVTIVVTVGATVPVPGFIHVIPP